MEDEICPYATFHLLGFREEMDPSKALAFPHHHAAHAGTLAHPHPHHPAHSRTGSQSMVTNDFCTHCFKWAALDRNSFAILNLNNDLEGCFGSGTFFLHQLYWE